MDTGGLVRSLDMSDPDPRTRSIWLTQLVLAATVITMSVLVLILEPTVFGNWTFSVGVAAIAGITFATLVTPWSRLPPPAALTVPFADAIAIALLAGNNDLRLGYLWVFPIMWVSMHFGAQAMAAMLTVISATLVLTVTADPGSVSVLRVFVILISLLFIAITTHLAMRHSRALRRLLLRQASRLNATASRRTDQERRTTEILNGVDTGVARISSSGVLLAVNDAYTQLYGIDPSDLSQPAGSAEYSGLRGMPVPHMDRVFARAARGEPFTDVRVWLFTPAGEWRTVSASTKRLSATEREEATTLLLVHDITAITHAERERERLAAIASHELKHPLTVMIGNAELALESPELSPKTRERLETILSASDRMLEMTTSMLSSSRGEGVARDAFDEIDLRPIVADSVASFRPTARTHDVSVQLSAEQPLLISGDGFRLRQVVDNLVSNAIKYTPSEGTVRIVAAVDGDSVSLAVADTGIGVSKDELPKLLTPYFRTSAAKQKASGTGLGLNITNEIIAAHSGTLTIESEEGLGTTVTVRLPHLVHTPAADLVENA